MEKNNKKTHDLYVKLVLCFFDVWRDANLNEERCDVCNSRTCVCGFEPACGGKEIEKWTLDELKAEFKALRANIIRVGLKRHLLFRGKTEWTIFYPEIGKCVSHHGTILRTRDLEQLRSIYRSMLESGFKKPTKKA